jgi:hypothetical protein
MWLGVAVAAAGLLAAFVLAVPTAVIIAVIGNSHYLDRS